MPTKTVIGEFEDESFMLENTWTDGLKLFRNDLLLVHNTDRFAIKKNKPIISQTVIIKNKEHLL